MTRSRISTIENARINRLAKSLVEHRTSTKSDLAAFLRGTLVSLDRLLAEQDTSVSAAQVRRLRALRKTGAKLLNEVRDDRPAARTVYVAALHRIGAGIREHTDNLSKGAKRLLISNRPGRRAGGLGTSLLLHACLVLAVLAIRPVNVENRPMSIHRSAVLLVPPERRPVRPPEPLRTVTREAVKPFVAPRWAPPPPRVTANIPAPTILPDATPPPAMVHVSEPPIDIAQIEGARAVPAYTPPIRRTAFDAAARTPDPPRELADGNVRTAGFDTAHNAASIPPGDAGAVRVNQFQAARAAEDEPVRQAAVTKAGFDRVTAVNPEAQRSIPRPAPVSRPVQLLDKPKPRYTEAARQHQIQGTVLLEVTFTDRGQIHIGRLVRGLGYGLDEAAVEAARNIQFKPATEDGKPVDQTLVVQIIFQLSTFTEK